MYDPLPMAHPFRNLTLEGIIADAKYGSHLLEQLQEGGGVRNVAAAEDEVEEDWVVIKDGESVDLPGLGKHQLEAARPAQAQRSGTSRKSRTHTRMSNQCLWLWITVRCQINGDMTGDFKLTVFIGVMTCNAHRACGRRLAASCGGHQVDFFAP